MKKSKPTANHKLPISKGIFNVFSGPTSNMGFSLIEMLIVVLVFTFLAVIATQSLTLSLRGSKKSESQIIVKENVDFALSTMERLLRNAQSITSCSATKIDYVDERDKLVYFECKNPGYIASNSAMVSLTSPDIVVDCTSVFNNCITDTTVPPIKPHSVDITLKASRAGVSGAEGSEITETTKILLRNY